MQPASKVTLPKIHAMHSEGLDHEDPMYRKFPKPWSILTNTNKIRSLTPSSSIKDIDNITVNLVKDILAPYFSNSS